MKSAVYIVYKICKRMEGARGRYLDYFVHFRGLESKRGNVKPSYLIEIHSEIGTFFTFWSITARIQARSL